MTLATKNGSLILKDGRLAENCGCCGGWYCDLVPSPPCCSSQSLSLVINFTASPQVGSPRFGEDAVQALKDSFPVTINRTVTLEMSQGKYVFSSGFDYFGTGEANTTVVVSISDDSFAGPCACRLRVEDMSFKWKWDLRSQGFSPGDVNSEPANFQYGDLWFISNGISFSFGIGQTPCFQATTLSVNGQTRPGYGSAAGTIVLSPA
jgi:hypothetical protein